MSKLTDMQVFAKVADSGSFAAAARSLDMSSQAVGKHIAALEIQLGTRLISRTTRHHSLTEAGQLFYHRCKTILAQIEAAEAEIAETCATPRGLLRINAPLSFGIHSLSARLPLYLQRYPEVSIDLQLSDGMVDLVNEGFDVAIRTGALTDSSLNAKPLTPYRLMICATPDYLAKHAPVHTPQDLLKHELVMFNKTDLRHEWIFLRGNETVRLPVAGRLNINDNTAQLKAVLAGGGIILQSQDLLQPLVEQGLLVQILSDYTLPERPVHALYAGSRLITPKLRSFLDFLGEMFPA